MDENEKKEPETAQEPPKPENYSRYMGTLNRIYKTQTFSVRNFSTASMAAASSSPSAVTVMVSP